MDVNVIYVHLPVFGVASTCAKLLLVYPFTSPVYTHSYHYRQTIHNLKVSCGLPLIYTLLMFFYFFLIFIFYLNQMFLLTVLLVGSVAYLLLVLQNFPSIFRGDVQC